MDLGDSKHITQAPAQTASSAFLRHVGLAPGGCSGKKTAGDQSTNHMVAISPRYSHYIMVISW